MTDLILEHIHKRYGEKVVLRDFSTRFPAGTCTCIMGPSGCGKTTLLRLILGLEEADGGTISGRRFPMSAVFQENRLFEDFSALSNVSAVCARGSRQEAARQLSALGLAGSLHAPVRTLSGGMKRRVAIARALAAPGDLLLLDEPFTGIDEERRAEIAGHIRDRYAGKLVVLVTHDEAECSLLHGTLRRLPDGTQEKSGFAAEYP